MIPAEGTSAVDELPMWPDGLVAPDLIFRPRKRACCRKGNTCGTVVGSHASHTAWLTIYDQTSINSDCSVAMITKLERSLSKIVLSRPKGVLNGLYSVFTLVGGYCEGDVHVENNVF